MATSPEVQTALRNSRLGQVKYHQHEIRHVVEAMNRLKDDVGTALQVFSERVEITDSEPSGSQTTPVSESSIISELNLSDHEFKLQQYLRSEDMDIRGILQSRMGEFRRKHLKLHKQAKHRSLSEKENQNRLSENQEDNFDSQIVELDPAFEPVEMLSSNVALPVPEVHDFSHDSDIPEEIEEENEEQFELEEEEPGEQFETVVELIEEKQEEESPPETVNPSVAVVNPSVNVWGSPTKEENKELKIVYEAERARLNSKMKALESVGIVQVTNVVTDVRKQAEATGKQNYRKGALKLRELLKILDRIEQACAQLNKSYKTETKTEKPCPVVTGLLSEPAPVVSTPKSGVSSLVNVTEPFSPFAQQPSPVSTQPQVYTSPSDVSSGSSTIKQSPSPTPASVLSFVTPIVRKQELRTPVRIPTAGPVVTTPAAVPVEMEEPSTSEAISEDPPLSLDLRGLVNPKRYAKYRELMDLLEKVNKSKDELSKGRNERVKKLYIALKNDIQSEVNFLDVWTGQDNEKHFKIYKTFFDSSQYKFPPQNASTTFDFAATFVVERLLKKLAQDEQLVNSCAYIVNGLMNEFGEKFRNVFLAHLYSVAPITVPFYKPGIEVLQSSDSLKADQYLKKQSIYVRLLLHLAATKSKKTANSIGFGDIWTFLADICNLTLVPAITANVIHEVHTVLSPQLSRVYGSQFSKLLSVLEVDVYKSLYSMTHDDQGRSKGDGPASGAMGRLKLLFNNSHRR